MALPLPGPDGGPLGLRNLRAFRDDPLAFLQGLQATYGDRVRLRLGGADVAVLHHPDDIARVHGDQRDRLVKWRRARAPFERVTPTNLVILDGAPWQRLRPEGERAIGPAGLGASAASTAARVAGWARALDGETFEATPAFDRLHRAALCADLFGFADVDAEAPALAAALDAQMDAFIRDAGSPVQIPVWLPTSTNHLRRANRAAIDAALTVRLGSGRAGDDVLARLAAGRGADGLTPASGQPADADRGGASASDTLGDPPRSRLPTDPRGDRPRRSEPPPFGMTPGSGDRAGQPADVAPGAATASGALSDEEIVAFVQSLYVAGRLTPVRALTWGAWRLATHPDVQARARAEVASVTGGAPLSASHLPKLGYLRQVLLETLRLHPPAWSLVFREVVAPVALDGLTLPVGAVVYTSPWIVQHDPRFWPDPERFDPDRFAAGPSGGAPAGAWLALGGDLRRCLGQDVVATSWMASIAGLLQAGSLETDDPDVRPRAGFTLEPDRPVRMRVRGL
jgi:cytochrome P450